MLEDNTRPSIEKVNKPRKEMSKQDIEQQKKHKAQPRNLKQRRDRVRQKKASFIKKLEAMNQ